MILSTSYIQELAYLDSVVVVVVVIVIPIVVESEINHLLRIRQKFPEGKRPRHREGWLWDLIAKTGPWDRSAGIDDHPSTPAPLS